MALDISLYQVDILLQFFVFTDSNRNTLAPLLPYFLKQRLNVNLLRIHDVLVLYCQVSHRLDFFAKLLRLGGKTFFGGCMLGFVENLLGFKFGVYGLHVNNFVHVLKLDLCLSEKFLNVLLNKFMFFYLIAFLPLLARVQHNHHPQDS